MLEPLLHPLQACLQYSSEECQNVTDVFFSGSCVLKALLPSLTRSCFNQFYFLNEAESRFFLLLP